MQARGWYASDMWCNGEPACTYLSHGSRLVQRERDWLVQEDLGRGARKHGSQGDDDAVHVGN